MTYCTKMADPEVLVIGASPVGLTLAGVFVHACACVCGGEGTCACVTTLTHQVVITASGKVVVHCNPYYYKAVSKQTWYLPL